LAILNIISKVMQAGVTTILPVCLYVFLLVTLVHCVMTKRVSVKGG